MKVGDIVILKKGRYKFTPTEEGKWVWTEVLGVITDNSGLIDGTAEYKVYTADNKHTWEHVDDLLIPD